MTAGARMALHQHPSPVEGTSVIAVEGDFDLDGAAKFVQRCEDLAEGGVFRLVVDMSGVAFMDSSGINALLRAHRLLAGSGGWIRLARVYRPAGHVIELVGLDQVIPVHPDTETALHAT